MQTYSMTLLSVNNVTKNMLNIASHTLHLCVIWLILNGHTVSLTTCYKHVNICDVHQCMATFTYNPYVIWVWPHCVESWCTHTHILLTKLQLLWQLDHSLLSRPFFLFVFSYEQAVSVENWSSTFQIHFLNFHTHFSTILSIFLLDFHTIVSSQ